MNALFGYQGASPALNAHCGYTAGSVTAAKYTFLLPVSSYVRNKNEERALTPARPVDGVVPKRIKGRRRGVITGGRARPRSSAKVRVIRGPCFVHEGPLWGGLFCGFSLGTQCMPEGRFRFSGPFLSLWLKGKYISHGRKTNVAEERFDERRTRHILTAEAPPRALLLPRPCAVVSVMVRPSRRALFSSSDDVILTCACVCLHS